MLVVIVVIVLVPRDSSCEDKSTGTYNFKMCAYDEFSCGSGRKVL